MVSSYHIIKSQNVDLDLTTKMVVFSSMLSQNTSTKTTKMFTKQTPKRVLIATLYLNKSSASKDVIMCMNAQIQSTKFSDHIFYVYVDIVIYL